MELDNQFKESLESLTNTLKILPRYQRETCKDCKYILACTGECDKTLKGDKDGNNN